MSLDGSDRDGQVGRAEFPDHPADWMALIDSDGSGDIRPANLGPRG